MSEEIPTANPPPSSEEEFVVAQLKDDDLHVIDEAILSQSNSQWLKVARVVAWTESALSDRYPGLSCIFMRNVSSTLRNKAASNRKAIWNTCALAESGSPDKSSTLPKAGFPIPVRRAENFSVFS